MSEGTFIGPDAGWDFKEDATIASVATPSQLPQKFKTDSLPENVLRSRAVEALIQQNDDLMSRLTVGLRRISELEDHIQITESENEKYKTRYENLRDQVLVLKEKTRILTERKDSKDSDTQTLKNEIQLLEIRYSELYQSTQQKESRIQSELLSNQLQNQRFSKYGKKLSQIAHSLRNAKTATEQKAQRLHDQLAQNEIVLDSVRKSASESANYIQEQAKKHDTEIQTLTLSFENQIQQLMAKNSLLQNRCNDYEILVDKNAQLENDVVIAERRLADQRLQFQAESTDLQKDLARYRSENKESTLELQSLKTHRDELNELAQRFKRDNQSLEEQVETLQALWKDNQLQIEKLQEKNRSIQKLNQDLSAAINQYRKEIRELKEKIDRSNIEVKTTTQERTNENTEFMQKIDQALGRIEVGS